MPKEYLDRIRAKYPQYKDIDDSTLAAKVLAKYPQYKDQLGDLVTSKSQDQPQTSQQVQTTPMQRIGEAFSQPGQLLNRGIEQAQSGHPVAGGLNMAAGVLTAPFAPVSAAIQGLREIPSGGITQGIADAASGLANVIPSAVRTGEELIQSGLESAGLVGQSKPTPESEAMSNMNQLAGQLLLGPEAVKRAPEMTRAAIPEGLAERFAAKAGKFTGTPEQVLKKANVALREGINPSNLRGLEKLNAAVDRIDNQVQSFGKSDEFIYTDNAMKHIQGLIDQVNRQELAPEQAISDIKSKVEDIYRQRGEKIPTDLALSLKKGIYKRESAAYATQRATGKLPGYDTQTEMQIAKGINDELKKMWPEAKGLLSRESDLLDIRKDIRRNVRNELTKSNLPSSFLLAVSPKWWLTKMIATNKTLEYNLGRLLYRARGVETPSATTSTTAEPPPFKPDFFTRPSNESLSGKAVNEGADATHAEAATKFRDYVKRDKELKDAFQAATTREQKNQLFKEMSSVQRGREFAEGFIAKTENRPWRAMTPNEIKDWFSKAVPDAAKTARGKAVSGAKLTLRERNLIRQHFPDEKDELLGSK